MPQKIHHHVTIAQWGQAPLLIYLPFYVALYGGYMDREGLTAKLIYAGSDEDVFTAVNKGRADFGLGDPILSELHRKKGEPGVSCVALLVKRVPIWGITHNPAIPPLEHIEDFVHLRIGSLPRNSTTHSLIEGLKINHKRLLKYTKIVEAPIDEQFELLTQGKADVILGIEPYVSMAEYQGLAIVFSLAQFYGDFAFTGLTVSDSFSDQSPTLVAKMLRALAQGLKICHTDKTKALKIAAKIFPDCPKEILEKGIRRLRSSNVWPQLGLVDPKAWEAALQLRRKIGHLGTKYRS